MIAADAPIRAVVWDFGGVLITPITQAARRDRRLARDHDGRDARRADGAARDVDRRSPVAPRRARGAGDRRRCRPRSPRSPTSAGLTLRGDEYERLLCGVFDVHHDVVERIGELRAEGYRTGLLTNSFKEFRDHLEAHVDFGVFDVVVDSSEVGLRKPEPEIYDLTTEMLGVPADEILYLDDFAANLVGAEAAGWRTIHVTDVGAALAALDLALAGSDQPG